jgi:beta-lactamase regulating signal transducer with metallopeptidase domain
VIAWLVETAVAVTLLMLIVLVLRGPVARSFGAGWAYALWAVPALRLVLPPLPQLAPELSIPPVVFFIPTAAEMTAPSTAEAGSGQWVPLILAMWAGGAVIFLILQWLAYRSFLGELDQTSRPARPPAFGGIRTWISSAVSGPLALGLIERRIVVPTDFMRRYGPGERRLALQHELVHHRRGDLWWNVAAMIVLALLWFSPVAWIAFRAFRSDQELACDAAVARDASADERCDYARALIKSASRPGLIAVSALNPAGQLKRRLRMIRAHRASPLRAAGGTAALSALAFAGFALGSGGAAPAAAPDAQVASAPRPPARPSTASSATELASIVVTAPRRGARRPLHAARPARPAIAAVVEAPRAPAEASMAQLLGHLPQVSFEAAAQPQVRVAIRRQVPGHEVAERHVFRISSDGATREYFVVATRMSRVDRAAIERAVAEALGHAQAEPTVRARAEAAPEGSGGGKFEIDIQTIEQGE